MYPHNLLPSKPDTAGWHNFGMEWKEHAMLAAGIDCFLWGS
jgi:hypothetical protein